MFLSAIRALIVLGVFTSFSSVSFAAPTNDNCSGAVSLTLGVANTSGTVAHATASSSIPFPAACTGTPDDDVWYSFTISAFSKTAIVSVTATGSNLISSGVRVQLFSGSCTALVSLGCGTTSVTANDLPAGTYYVRVFSAGSSGLNNNAGFSITAWASPRNDEYTNATLLTSSTTCVTNTDTLYLATANTSVTAGCATTGTHYDVWYSFVAANTTETVTISNTGSNLTAATELQLYNSTLGSLQCSSTSSLTATGLTVNATYYVRFSSVGNDPTNSSTNNFDICVTHPIPPPSNDDCSGAITLTSSTTTCTSPPARTLAGATNSGIAVGSCGGTADDDVWFKFAAVGSNTTINLTSISTGTNSLASAGIVVEVFYSASSSCSALTYVTCASFPSSATAAQSLNVFTANTTGLYYVRVFSIATGAPTGSSTFSICVTHVAPPTNDNCSNATVLSSGTINSSGTLWSATSSAVSTACSGTADDDVWYSFTATATTGTIALSGVGTNLSSAGTVMQLFSGSCSSLTSLACGTTSISATGLTVNSTYFVRVYSNTSGSIGGTSTGSAFSITFNAPPSNDDCSGATSIAVGGSVSGTVWFATNSGVSAVCSGTPDDDVWYKFTATATSATVTLSGLGTNLSASGAEVQLFSGSCGSLTSRACGSSGLIALALTSGNTYYLRVYSVGSGSIGGTSTGSAFTISITAASTLTTSSATTTQTNEVFQQTILSAANVLSDPWEVAYGPDGNLWITEAKGYKVYRMDPNTGLKSTILDISNNSTFLLPGDTTFNVKFTQSSLNTACSCWPQGGMAGLVLHPKFMDPVAPVNYVYISYVYKYNGSATNNGGVFFTNRLVRFTYNKGTGLLESPVSVCDTLPGSSDHNSQRMIIAPVNGTYYLFYAQGDMGAGQFGNSTRTENAQNTTSYEGKILRFNLTSDGDAGTLDQWIPNDNPYNTTTPTKQSAIWSIGIRNNQGFAYANINGTDYLYGSSHGPFSDDEINIIEKGKNYGHPLVIGYAADGNYNNSKAGNGSGNTLPLIVSESANATTIGSTYQDPIFSIYAAPKATVNNIYTTNPSNSGWPSEAPSGMDVYTNSAIPGWKNSLLVSYLKGGRVMRLKLNTAGTGINTTDTVGYFWSINRFRDVALLPDGKTIFTIIDKSSTTSGPTAITPMVSACAGCVLKYTFLGYNTVNSRSAISTAVSVTTGTDNTCNTATTVTIDATNNNLWVPITGSDGNIMAEIKANGNNLGKVTASFYTNSGTIRKDRSGRPYLDRNMTITPQTQPDPTKPVTVRLYLTAAELNALKSATGSGVAGISTMYIYKNSDACGSAIASQPLSISPTIAEAFGTTGYVLQASITSFSSFYFGGPVALTTLPLQVVTFKGALQKNDAVLQWETANEQNTDHFSVERSTDGVHFEQAGTLNARGNGNGKYGYTDKGAALLATDALYYRLKTIDKDGLFSYSSVVMLHVPHNVDVMVFPNPVKSLLTIRINNSEGKEVTVQVSDVQGRVVYTKQESLHASLNNISIDARRWTPQLYVVKVMNSKGEVLATQKFEKAD